MCLLKLRRFMRAANTGPDARFRRAFRDVSPLRVCLLSSAVMRRNAGGHTGSMFDGQPVWCLARRASFSTPVLVVRAMRRANTSSLSVVDDRCRATKGRPLSQIHALWYTPRSNLSFTYPFANRPTPFCCSSLAGPCPPTSRRSRPYGTSGHDFPQPASNDPFPHRHAVAHVPQCVCTHHR
ncbi:hypothetical protein GY45DRAFT_1327436 [Cubamyces sp. BRFM 1775]|nr:hypothetical protein GY45DRAFT_1327436 [Cubamyces sp. BRFM 1775]